MQHFNISNISIWAFYLTIPLPTQNNALPRKLSVINYSLQKKQCCDYIEAP